jgi:short-subunit dehydrogenase
MHRNVMSNGKRVAVVTGASSGIGEAIANKLAHEGYRLALVARRKDRLTQLAGRLRKAGNEVVVLPSDLADHDDCERVFGRVKAALGSVDVLINNAGLGWYGYGEAMPWDKARQMIEVNITSLTKLTLTFLSEMKKRGRGHIINIGSIAGSIPSQGVALYSATKAFVDALSTSLYRELAGTNVKVSVVRTGAVATGFYDIASEGSAGPRIPVEWLAIRPETVADRVWKLIQNPARVLYVPRTLRFVPWIELSFGWLMDRIGPLLLRLQLKESPIRRSPKD